MQLFQKILCPIDFSEFSLIALRYASALARENEAQLILYHSVPDLTQAVSYIEGNYMDTVHDMLTSNADAKLDDFVRGFIDDMDVERKVGTGSPTEAILEIAHSSGVDLIVMGTHGHTGPERFFMGSVTNKILHKSNVPVLVVCKPQHHFVKEGELREVEINRIVCAVDLEPNNSRIRDLALSIGRIYQSEVYFLHIAPETETIKLSEQQERALPRLHSLVDPEKEDWCKVRFVVERGDAADELVKISTRMEADLIVMGHHTRKPIEELFLGSVAKKVVVDSQCPVLVVRSHSV